MHSATRLAAPARCGWRSTRRNGSTASSCSGRADRHHAPPADDGAEASSRLLQRRGADARQARDLSAPGPRVRRRGDSRHGDRRALQGEFDPEIVAKPPLVRPKGLPKFAPSTSPATPAWPRCRRRRSCSGASRTASIAPAAVVRCNGACPIAISTSSAAPVTGCSGNAPKNSTRRPLPFFCNLPRCGVSRRCG